jgi:uncharacterized membrane protein
MIDFKVIFNLRFDAIKSIKKDSDGVEVDSCWRKIFFYFIWYGIPFIAVGIVIMKQIKLSSLENYVGASVALFTGLFFSLLLSLGDKLSKEKENPDSDSDHYESIKENLRQISKITQFVILTGLVIFVLLLINTLLKTDKYIWIETLLTSISIYCLTQYTVSILFLLQRFHHTLKDELGNN